MKTDSKQYLQNLSEDFIERLKQINSALFTAGKNQNSFPNPPTNVELKYPDWLNNFLGGRKSNVRLTPDPTLPKGVAGEYWNLTNNVSYTPGMHVQDPTITHELGHAQQTIAAQFKNRNNLDAWLESIKNFNASGGKEFKNEVARNKFQPQIPYEARKAEVDARAMGASRTAQNFKDSWMSTQHNIYGRPQNPVMTTLSKYFPKLAPQIPSLDQFQTQFNAAQRAAAGEHLKWEDTLWQKAKNTPTDLKQKVGDFVETEKGSGRIVSSGSTPDEIKQFHKDRRSYRNEMDPRNLKRAKGKIASGWQAGLDLFDAENGPKDFQEWMKSNYDAILAKRGQAPSSIATPSTATPTTPQAKPKTPTPVSTAPKQATMEPKAPLRSGGIEVPETPMASRIATLPEVPKEPMVREFAPRGAKGGIGGIKIPLIGFGLAAATALANKAFGDTPTSWTDVANQTLEGGLESLNPLGIFDGGSLGTDDLPAELKGQYNFIEPKPKEQKELPGSEYMFPNKSEEPKPAPTPQPENTPEDVPSPKPGIRPASRGSEEQPPKTNTEPEKKDQEEDENPNSFKNQMKQVVFECLIKATK